MRTLRLRPAATADLAEINAIFNRYVATSTCVWTTHETTAAERAAWFASHDDATPVLVAEARGRIVGWGALAPFVTACTFHKTAENSVYVHPDCQRRGIGGRILCELVRMARRAGYISIVASISADQAASIALHRKAGFEEMGRLRQVGYKFDAFRDLVYLQLRLADR
ncbi:MAG: GNAT family N-acetyltransferase [Desulfosarcinaceae bacterium]|nr:GNAT family N-acetyltransferase [Desulfosarcinaceae bacterium]